MNGNAEATRRVVVGISQLVGYKGDISSRFILLHLTSTKYLQKANYRRIKVQAPIMSRFLFVEIGKSHNAQHSSKIVAFFERIPYRRLNSSISSDGLDHKNSRRSYPMLQLYQSGSRLRLPSMQYLFGAEQNTWLYDSIFYVALSSRGQKPKPEVFFSPKRGLLSAPER